MIFSHNGYQKLDKNNIHSCSDPYIVGCIERYKKTVSTVPPQIHFQAIDSKAESITSH